MLVYVGKGGFVPGIPARDLTPDEVTRLGGADAIMLRAPGLYKQKKTRTTPKREQVMPSGVTRDTTED